MHQDLNQGIEDKHFEHKLSHKERIKEQVNLQSSIKVIRK